MAAMDATPFQIFCGYYLGLDLQWKYRFFNMHSLALHLEMDPQQLRDRMDDLRLAPEDTRHVDYNLAKAHAIAQELADEGQRLDVEAFAKKTFEEFQQAKAGYDPNQDFENVDYDDIFAKKKEN